MPRTPYICTVAELRDDGVPERFEDGFLTNKILSVEDMWEDPTVSGWWFESRVKTFTLDGNDRDEIVVKHPIIAITEIKVDAVAQTLTDFVWRSVSDDIENMHNRKIEYTGYNNYSTVRLRSHLFNPVRDNYGIFAATNPQNVEITGTFGCVTSTGTVPPAVNRASRKWVIRELDNLYDLDLRENFRAISSIKRLGMSKEFAPSSIGAGVTGDPEIDRIIAMYRPHVIGA